MSIQSWIGRIWKEMRDEINMSNTAYEQFLKIHYFIFILYVCVFDVHVACVSASMCESVGACVS